MAIVVDCGSTVHEYLVPFCVSPPSNPARDSDPAQLFVNLNTNKIGEIGTRDAVVFDEIANTDFTDPKAFGSLVFVGNIDVQGKMPHEKYYHLFEPLPDFLQVIAFLDRVHGYLPGWETPKLTPESYSKDYGFITDYEARRWRVCRDR